MKGLEAPQKLDWQSKLANPNSKIDIARRCKNGNFWLSAENSLLSFKSESILV
ncbi:hypothetical protein O77CONTIG1_00616 [Leptolyngbya sp. O-77]|nr:hypothetical protein O77CONTIG1_00616 [Leptolyngbya sp. O-77]